MKATLNYHNPKAKAKVYIKVNYVEDRGVRLVKSIELLQSSIFEGRKIISPLAEKNFDIPEFLENIRKARLGDIFQIKENNVTP